VDGSPDFPEEGACCAGLVRGGAGAFAWGCARGAAWTAAFSGTTGAGAACCGAGGATPAVVSAGLPSFRAGCAGGGGAADFTAAFSTVVSFATAAATGGDCTTGSAIFSAGFSVSASTAAAGVFGAGTADAATSAAGGGTASEISFCSLTGCSTFLAPVITICFDSVASIFATATSAVLAPSVGTRTILRMFSSLLNSRLYVYFRPGSRSSTTRTFLSGDWCAPTRMPLTSVPSALSTGFTRPAYPAPGKSQISRGLSPLRAKTLGA